MWYFCGATAASFFFTQCVSRMSLQEGEYQEKAGKTAVREARDGPVQKHRPDAGLHMGLITHTSAVQRATRIQGLKVGMRQTSTLSTGRSGRTEECFWEDWEQLLQLWTGLLQQPAPFSAEYTHACITLPFSSPFFVLWLRFQPSGNVLYDALLCYKSPFQFN